MMYLGCFQRVHILNLYNLLFKTVNNKLAAPVLLKNAGMFSFLKFLFINQSRNKLRVCNNRLCVPRKTFLNILWCRIHLKLLSCLYCFLGSMPIVHILASRLLLLYKLSCCDVLCCPLVRSIFEWHILQLKSFKFSSLPLGVSLDRRAFRCSLSLSSLNYYTYALYSI